MVESIIATTQRKLVSPAFIVVVCLWALAVLVLFTLGKEARSEAWQDLAMSPILFGLMAATQRLSRRTAGDFPCPTESSPRVRLQLFVIVAIILLTGFGYLASRGISGWSTLTSIFSRIGKHTPAGSLGAANFGHYALIPGILVLMLGARLGQIGLGPFPPSSLRVAVAWCILPFAALGYAACVVIRMHKSAWFILSLFTQNFFQNGISEEFLWRGLLLTRMRKFIRDDWANLVQAVLFGAWHFRYDYKATDGHLAYTISAMVASQVAFGYAMGWLLLRMRNVAIPAVFHAAFDTLGSVYS